MENLTLHPDIHWIIIDKNRIQIRQPNGDHITFDKYADEINNILNLLKDSTAQVDFIDESLMKQVVELFISKGFLTHKNNSTKTQFQRIVDLNKNNVFKNKSITPPKSVFLAGEGKLFEITREALVKAEIKINESNNPNSLKIVIADQDDHAFLSEENKKAIDQNQQVLFFRWTNGKYRIGPFVIPGETACLECANVRELGSNLFVDEMKAYMSCDKTNLPKYEGGPVLDDMAMSIITRQLIMIFNGNYEMTNLSSITTIDPLLLEIKHSPILRLPRCKVCSKSAQQPLISYHNLVHEALNINS